MLILSKAEEKESNITDDKEGNNMYLFRLFYPTLKI